MNDAQTPTSEVNHTLLVQLGDSVGNLTKQVGEHITNQAAENKAIHTRIDQTQNDNRKGIDEIKEIIGQRGRVAPIHVAVLISLLVGIGGFGNTFMEMKLASERPKTEANSVLIQESMANSERIQEELNNLRVDNARTDAASAENRRWLEKGIDELKTELNNLKPK